MSRPTKLTPDIQDKICARLQVGASYRDAAESVGVTYETFSNWVKRGKAEQRGMYFRFLLAVGLAEAICAANMAATFAKAANEGDWRAAESWLKRRRPDEWGDLSKVEHRGEGGGPIVFRVIRDDRIPDQDEDGA